MSLLPPRLRLLRLWTLVASVLALLLLTFGSVSVDVYRPVATTSTNMAEIPTEELAHETVSPKATASTRLQMTRRRSATGNAMYVVAAAHPATAARRLRCLPPAAAQTVTPSRHSSRAPVPLRC
jgi:hypothetical protein